MSSGGSGPRDGIEGLVDVVAEDTVTYAFPGWVGKSKQVGPDGLRAMLAEWNEAFTEYEMELSETREAGDRVVALAVQRGITKEAGVPISARIGAVYSDFRENGMIGEVRYFPSWEEALEAAGLEEELSVHRTGGEAITFVGRDRPSPTGAGPLAAREWSERHAFPRPSGP